MLESLGFFRFFLFSRMVTFPAAASDAFLNSFLSRC